MALYSGSLSSLQDLLEFPHRPCREDPAEPGPVQDRMGVTSVSTFNRFAISHSRGMFSTFQVDLSSVAVKEDRGGDVGARHGGADSALVLMELHTVNHLVRGVEAQF